MENNTPAAAAAGSCAVIGTATPELDRVAGVAIYQAAVCSQVASPFTAIAATSLCQRAVLASEGQAGIRIDATATTTIPAAGCVDGTAGIDPDVPGFDGETVLITMAE